jgi:predicted nucleic-acid-binding Zn-ribbon protein
MKSTPCPTCGGQNLYWTRTDASGGYGPTLLPGLGGFLRSPQFFIVVCADCGLTRFFAAEDERAKVTESKKWFKVSNVE